jgi:16S rRNA processing protein RimM
MRIDDCFELGHIIKPHGLHGEVWMLIDADLPEAYQELESVFLETKGELIPFFIESISIQGNKALLAFEEVEDVETASTLSGRKVFLPLAFLPELDKDQFYFHEIQNFRVLDEIKGEIGRVKEIVSASSQDLLIVAHPSGAEILIPMADEVMRGVDKTQQELRVNCPEGLIELYLEADED